MFAIDAGSSMRIGSASLAMMLRVICPILGVLLPTTPFARRFT
jgi:hypothetical protein